MSLLLAACVGVDAWLLLRGGTETGMMILVLQPNHSAYSLDAIAARFGVYISVEERHTALGVARGTARIFAKMLPVLHRNGLATLDQVLKASSRVFHIRRQQERYGG